MNQRHVIYYRSNSYAEQDSSLNDFNKYVKYRKSYDDNSNKIFDYLLNTEM